MKALSSTISRKNCTFRKLCVILLLLALSASLFRNASAATNAEKAREIAKYGLSVPSGGFNYSLFGGHNNTTYMTKSYYKFSDVSEYDSWLKNTSFLVGVTEYFFVRAEGSSIDRNPTTNKFRKTSALLISQIVTGRDASDVHNYIDINIKGYSKAATAKYTERTRQTSISCKPSGSRANVTASESNSTACNMGVSISGSKLGFSASETSTYGQTLAVTQENISNSGKYLYDSNGSCIGMFCSYDIKLGNAALKKLAHDNTYNCTYVFSYETEVTMVSGGCVVNRTTTEVQWDEKNARPVCTTSFYVEAELNGRSTNKTVSCTFKCPVIATY
jgi:hypothetical protein